MPLVRELSDQAVLDAIFHYGPSTRPVLAKATGLSKPTVSDAVRRLVEAGLVVEAGERQRPGPGRTPVLYAVHPMSAYVVGVDVGGVNARAAVGDVYGSVLAEREEPSEVAGGKVADQLVDLVESVLAEAGVTPSAVLTVAVSTPGVVDPATQRLQLAYNLGVEDEFDLVRPLRDAFGVPVVVENNVNLSAVGERWRGLAQGETTFAFVAIGAGIGMGLVYDDELIRGSHGAAGEIGYLPLSPGPVDRRHHTRGALEDLVGSTALLKAARGRDGWPGGPPDTVQELFDLADTGVAPAGTIVDELAERVGLAIASIASIIDPGLVILGGGIGGNPALLEPVRRLTREVVPFPPRVETTLLGRAAPLYGATHVAVVTARELLATRRHG